MTTNEILAKATAEYEKWLSSSAIDENTALELESIRGKNDEIIDRFSQTLKFGTAGLRGIMRAGLNAMNIYVIRRATQGLADYINHHASKISTKNKSVVIVYDSRINSFDFAKEAASVLAANGINVLFYGLLRPTPVASFCVRALNTIAGIAVTASHNPKMYNGYKVFSDDGTQLSVEDAKIVAEYIDKVDIFDDIKNMSFDAACAEGKIKILGQETDELYMNAVMEQRVDKDILRNTDLSVVHTPLHGASFKLVPDVLRLCGLKKVYSVDSQLLPDGNFPTAPKPNPELECVYGESIELAKKVNADIIIANDPDSDRIGVVVLHNGEYVRLSGNQTGALLLNYMLSHLHTDAVKFAVKTIVTTELTRRVCEKYNCELIDCLTGFKNIGEVVAYRELHTPSDKFVMGYEESYGYLIGKYARDKDGVVAAMAICEMAASSKLEGKTLIDKLEELYSEFGFYGEYTVNIEFTGFDGNLRRETMMRNLRNSKPSQIVGYNVIKVDDYLEDGHFVRGTDIVMKENVLYFNLENNNVVVVRPSGTEPKIKLYYLLNGKREHIENIFKKGGAADDFAAKLHSMAYDE